MMINAVRTKIPPFPDSCHYSIPRTGRSSQTPLPISPPTLRTVPLPLGRSRIHVAGEARPDTVRRRDPGPLRPEFMRSRLQGLGVPEVDAAPVDRHDRQGAGGRDRVVGAPDQGPAFPAPRTLGAGARAFRSSRNLADEADSTEWAVPGATRGHGDACVRAPAETCAVPKAARRPDHPASELTPVSHSRQYFGEGR